MQRPARWEERRLLMVVAAMEIFFGIATHLMPEQFDAPSYAPIHDHLKLFAALNMVGGLSTLLLLRYSLSGAARTVATLCGAIPALVLTWLFGKAQVWTGMLLYGSMALLLLSAPVRERAGRGAGDRVYDLGALALSLVVGTVGVLMLVAPELFRSPAYAPMAEWLSLAGLAGIAGGCALVVLGLNHPVARWLRTGLPLLAAVLPVALTVTFLQTGLWTGMSWGIWALVLMTFYDWFPDLLPAARPAAHEEREALQRTAWFLEVWAWAVAVLIVLLSALGPVHLLPPSLQVNLFVAGVAIANVLFFWFPPMARRPQLTLHLHTLILAAGVSVLLSDSTSTPSYFAALLVVPPALGARMLGKREGWRLFWTIVAVLLGGHLVSAYLLSLPLSWWLAEVAVEGLVFGVVGLIALRGAEEEVRWRNRLATANERLQSQVQTMAIVGQIGTAIRRVHDLDQILATTSRALTDALDPTGCVIVVCSQATGRVHQHVHDRDVTVSPGEAEPRMERLMKAFLSQRHPVHVADLADLDLPPDHPFSDAVKRGRRFSVRAALGAPIEVDGQFLGAIVLYQRDQPRPWSEPEVDLVREVANQLAVALLQSDTYQALAEQNRAQARMTAILEATTDFVAIFDATGPGLWYNGAARSLIGLDESEKISARRMGQAQPEWARRIIWEEGIPAAAATGSWSGESAVLDREGRERPVSQLILAHRDQGAEVAYYSTIARDISQTKALEAALREQEEFFRSAFENAPIGVAIIAVDGTTLRANSAMAAMVGRPVSVLTHRPFGDLLHPDDRGEWEQAIADLRRDANSLVSVELRSLHQEGKVVWVRIQASSVRDDQGSVRYLVAQVQDVTEQRRFEAQLQYLASHDSLTGLPNRRHFQEELERRLSESSHQSGRGAVLFIDLDGFKYVNDSLGHHTGDQLLTKVAAVLSHELRESHLVARLGGDEFAVLLCGADLQVAQAAADRLMAALRKGPVSVDGQNVIVTASIGIALYPEHGTTGPELVARADLAMYQAKESGRDGVAFFCPQQEELANVKSRLLWERQVQAAIKENRLILHEQPVLDIRTERVVHHELLLRLLTDDGVLLSPGSFMEIAESYGLIHTIDHWVVRQALQILANSPDSTYAINLSARSLGNQSLLELLRTELRISGVKPDRLIIELTETAAVTNIETAARFITELRSLGCRFCVDDFGAGFSSFNYLKHLPVDHVKIDGIFIRNMLQNRSDQLLVKAMVEIAAGLGKQTVAEQVEDSETLAMLSEMGIDMVQGWVVGYPRPVGQIKVGPEP